MRRWLLGNVLVQTPLLESVALVSHRGLGSINVGKRMQYLRKTDQAIVDFRKEST